MSNFIAEVNLWNGRGAEGRLRVTTGFEVMAGDTVLSDVNVIGGLAMATLINHRDTLIPKSGLLPLVDTIGLGHNPLDDLDPKLNRQSKLTRGVNSYRRALRNPFAKNVLLLGSEVASGQCWYFATDLRDKEAVVESVTRQSVEESGIPDADAVVRSVTEMFDKKGSGHQSTPKPRVACSDRPEERLRGFRVLRPATAADNNAFLDFIKGSEPGTEISASAIEAWKVARGISSMETDKILFVASGLDLVRYNTRPPEKPGSSSEVIFIRQ